MDHNTHVLYKCHPTPGVSALRIVEDYLYTNDRNRDPIWNLPVGIRPVEQVVVQGAEPEVQQGPNEGDTPVNDGEEEQQEGEQQQQPPVPPPLPGQEAEALAAAAAAAAAAAQPEVFQPEAQDVRPTANLLGWARSTRLTNEQRQTVENCGISDEGFGANHARFAISLGLFEYIAGQIRRSAERYKAGSSFHEHTSGSLSQCAFEQRENQEEVFRRGICYVEGSIQACSAYQLEHRMSIENRVMAYRMAKEPINNLQSWCFFDFNRYRDVPAN